MSEKMAGVFALNVISEKDYMEINGVKILKILFLNTILRQNMMKAIINLKLRKIVKGKRK